MPAPTPLQAHAFRDLERALTRRRLMRLDPRMRGEPVLLALLIAGFLCWQVRVPLDGLVRARGPLSGVAAVAGVWLGLATLGAALTATGHARRRLAKPAGPEWLALPLEPAALERHLAWESRSRVPWLAVPALGVLAAGAGLLGANGLLPPDAGTVTFDGIDLWASPIQAKRRLGYAAEEPSFYGELSAEEYLAFVAAVRGLDPGGALAAKTELRALAAGGCAVLFSSHVTEIIERLCDRAVLLHGGRVARVIERSAWGGPPSGPSPLEREFLVVAGSSTR